MDFHVKPITISRKRIKLQIWDLGGEERFRFLLPSYVLGGNAAFLIYDVTTASTLNNIEEWISIVRKKGGNIPIILIGSKIDLPDGTRQVTTEKGKNLVKKHSLSGFIEISSKDNLYVDDAFETITRLALEMTEK